MRRIINGGAVGLTGTCHIVRRFGATFDLERFNAHRSEFFNMLNGAQIFGIHNVSAMHIFFDGHLTVRTLAFFEQIDVAAGILLRGMDFVVPSTGVGTGLLLVRD